MTPEQVERLIPKNCLIYNWFWSDEGDKEAQAEQNEDILDKMGVKQIFGNSGPDIQRYETRKKRATPLGGAPSAWFATSEIGIGKDVMLDFLGCSNILWTGHVIQGKKLSARIQSILPSIRSRLSGITPPARRKPRSCPWIYRADSILETVFPRWV
ncbi:MAG: hypothetical protein ABSC47_03870 [Terracidiphilus sp.]|jgi:hypothetical protein